MVPKQYTTTPQSVSLWFFTTPERSVLHLCCAIKRKEGLSSQRGRFRSVGIRCVVAQQHLTRGPEPGRVSFSLSLSQNHHPHWRWRSKDDDFTLVPVVQEPLFWQSTRSYTKHIHILCCGVGYLHNDFAFWDFWVISFDRFPSRRPFLPPGRIILLLVQVDWTDQYFRSTVDHPFGTINDNGMTYQRTILYCSYISM